MASFPAYVNQFNIGPDLHTSLPSPSWNSLEDEYNNYGHPYEPVLAHRLALGNAAIRDMSSIQRYIGGADDSPFTASPFHLTWRKLEMGGGLRPHEMAIPESFPRGGSPAGTTSSANSCWTTHHSEYASDQLGRHSISTQSACSPSMMSCDGYDVSQNQHTHFVSGGGCGISLNTIQPFDPDNAQNGVEECPIVEHSPLQHSYEPSYQYSIKAERCDSHQDCDDSDLEPSAPEHEDSDSVEASQQDEGSDTDYKPNRRSPLAGKRSRRRSSQSGNSPSRTNKRNSTGRKASLSNSPTSARIEKTMVKRGRPANNGNFPCVFAGYGCPSVFTSKNEWKRHVSTKHIKLVFWRCDLCPANADPKNPVHNDFNRKDLFTQHLRRMHANIDANGRINGLNPSKKGVSLTNAIPEDIIAKHQQRCCKELRQMPPRSSCLFCSRSFTGKDSWQERMDHIGTHLEKDRKSCEKANVADVTTWQADKELEQWLLEEGLIVQNAKRGWGLGDGTPLRIKQESQ